jgi:phosphoglycerol transferase MdoB-like AlkP superfamily enzyme
VKAKRLELKRRTRISVRPPKWRDCMELVCPIPGWARFPRQSSPLPGQPLSHFSFIPVRVHDRIEVDGWSIAAFFHLPTEVPILLCIYYLLNSILRPGRWTPYVAALPIVLAYTGFDIFYIVYGDVLRVIDIENLPNLLAVLPFADKAVMIFSIGIPLFLFIFFVDWRQYKRVLALSLLAVFLVTLVELFPRVILRGFKLVGKEELGWSDYRSVKRSGRLAMLLYFEASRRQALAETAGYRGRPDYELGLRAAAGYIKQRGSGRNVHLIVLESFLDPLLFRAVAYSMSPRHPAFAALVGDGMSFSVSPVFGGNSAQAEFEVLCGVPAFHELSAAEFSVFSGAAAGCMPDILARAGYTTIASNAFKPNFFNTTKAYTGFGFREIYFPAEYAPRRATYLSAANVSKEEEYMFDGDLFEQNLAFVARRLHENPDRPIFNYVLSLYGHEPYVIDPGKRPVVLSTNSKYGDGQLLLAANQHWYRTEAIARYVQALTALDPNSLIIMVSDHLPLLSEGTIGYKKLQYLDNRDGSLFLNRLLVVENGKIVRHPTIHHYDVPSLICDYLTSGSFCMQNDCTLSGTGRDRASYEHRYMRLMAHAVGPGALREPPL